MGPAAIWRRCSRSTPILAPAETTTKASSPECERLKRISENGAARYGFPRRVWRSGTRRGSRPQYPDKIWRSRARPLRKRRAAATETMEQARRRSRQLRISPSGVQVEFSRKRHTSTTAVRLAQERGPLELSEPGFSKSVNSPRACEPMPSRSRSIPAPACRVGLISPAGGTPHCVEARIFYYQKRRILLLKTFSRSHFRDVT